MTLWIIFAVMTAAAVFAVLWPLGRMPAAAGGGSDRLVDAMVAWGDEQAIRDRVAAQYKAGATHVCVTPVRSDGNAREPHTRTLEALAPR